MEPVGGNGVGGEKLPFLAGVAADDLEGKRDGEMGDSRGEDNIAKGKGERGEEDVELEERVHPRGRDEKVWRE